jgi:hypothetical protein
VIHSPRILDAQLARHAAISNYAQTIVNSSNVPNYGLTPLLLPKVPAVNQAGDGVFANHLSVAQRGDEFLFHTDAKELTIKMTDEEERATAARLEHAPARAPPHSVHRLVRAVHLLAL